MLVVSSLPTTSSHPRVTRWLVPLVPLAMCLGLTACGIQGLTPGKPQTQSDAETWIASQITPSVQYVNTEKNGTSVIYDFQDDSGLAFSVTAYVGGDLFPSYKLMTDYCSQWLKARSSQVDQLMAPYQLVFPQTSLSGFATSLPVQVVLPTYADIGPLAQNLGNLVNAFVLPMKPGATIAPPIMITEKASLQGPFGPRATDRQADIGWRTTNDPPVDVSGLATQMSNRYAWDMQQNDLDRTADPDFAAKVPANTVYLGCVVDGTTPCISLYPFSNGSWSRVPNGQVIAMLNLNDTTGEYFYSGWNFRLGRDGSGSSTSRDYSSSLGDAVRVLGGTYTGATNEATWTISAHTWHGTQTVASPSPTPGGNNVTSRTVTRDGTPIVLSDTAAAGGDLTVDDLKAVLGIDFGISQLLNWQEITYTD